ncbi:hypothetical protein BC943DRAFT_335520 [Umbelopsis sp. AD052]|nr:hypothetical protein BC943DRAFT_335520 [Umbelopsis sp. AD052]
MGTAGQYQNPASPSSRDCTPPKISREGAALDHEMQLSPVEGPVASPDDVEDIVREVQSSDMFQALDDVCAQLEDSFAGQEESTSEPSLVVVLVAWPQQDSAVNTNPLPKPSVPKEQKISPFCFCTWASVHAPKNAVLLGFNVYPSGQELFVGTSSTLLLGPIRPHILVSLEEGNGCPTPRCTWLKHSRYSCVPAQSNLLGKGIPDLVAVRKSRTPVFHKAKLARFVLREVFALSASPESNATPGFGSDTIIHKVSRAT